MQGPAFHARVPEIMHYTRVMGGGIHGDVRHGHRALRLRLLFVDASFFDVFSFRILHGSTSTALRDVNAVVITRRTAMKFFNRTDVVGELLQMDADPSATRLGKPLVVTGVTEDPPATSSIQFDILFPFEFMKLSFDDTSWLNAYLGTFIVLQQRADPERIIAKFNRIAAGLSQTQRKGHPEAQAFTYGLQRMTDIHLNSYNAPNEHGESGIVSTSKPIYSCIFIVMAGFVLLMASINFINIHIASSMRRAKEIGIRKATGSSATAIIAQFAGESSIVIFISMVLALMLTWLFLPTFNQLSQQHIAPGELFSSELSGWIWVIFLINIASAAWYPAWMISRLSPVETLYRKMQLGGRKASGNTLMAVQFTMAILLGIASLVFYKQMHFIRSKNLGYNPDQIIRIDISGVRDVQRVHQTFSDELAGDPAFHSISLVGEFGDRDVMVDGQKVRVNVRTVDEQYLPMSEIRLLEGRNFSATFGSDRTSAVLVNEAFVKAAGVKEVVGKTFLLDEYFGKQPMNIVGVVRDFHYHSLKERIAPMIMLVSKHYGGSSLWVKIAQDRERYALRKLEDHFTKVLPGAVFTYTFLHDDNARAYASELHWQQIISWLTAISAVICGLGLFALTHLAVAQRRRETGIRVVLGASGYEIALGFSRNFLRVLLAAMATASVAGHFLLQHWLDTFAYHAALSWWVYTGPGMAAILLAMATVFVQALRAAAADPIRILRSE